jgi:hypothetical protein
LDIKDYDVYDINPFDDHVSSDIIVCHEFGCDPYDDVSTHVSDSIPCFDIQLFNLLY